MKALQKYVAEANSWNKIFNFMQLKNSGHFITITCFDPHQQHCPLVFLKPMTTPLSQKGSFWQRIKNFIFSWNFLRKTIVENLSL